MSANATPITVVGRVITDITTRITTTGDKVANFRIACQERVYDKSQDLWSDGDRLYVTVVCWRSVADHVRDSLRKGDQVVATGRLKIREYTQDPGGTRKTTLEVNATAIGADLALHTVTVNRPDWSTQRPEPPSPTEQPQQAA